MFPKYERRLGKLQQYHSSIGEGVQVMTIVQQKSTIYLREKATYPSITA